MSLTLFSAPPNEIGPRLRGYLAPPL